MTLSIFRTKNNGRRKIKAKYKKQLLHKIINYKLCEIGKKMKKNQKIKHIVKVGNYKNLYLQT